MTIFCGRETTLTAGADEGSAPEANGSCDPGGLPTSRKPGSTLACAEAENGSTARPARSVRNCFLASEVAGGAGGAGSIAGAALLLPWTTFSSVGDS